ncbi:MAG: immune inhibitor A [Chloroflexi bacterium]|nr:immune inhibitor A [Chloroflexota bacterium]MCL5108141.1 immune inhibitor A [Chloroflexota bacterium]
MGPVTVRHYPWETERPPRDLFDLAARFGITGSHTVSPTAEPAPSVGTTHSFWVQQSSPAAYRSARATLVTISPHAYFYVEEGVDVPATGLAQSVNDFENRALPVVGSYFGLLDRPGPDGDGRVAVLICRLPGLDGYHSGFDEFPAWLHHYSNERHIIYMSAASATPGTSAFAALMAHELQHLVRWLHQPAVDNWINEGCSELAASWVSGIGDRGVASTFMASPETQLTTWAPSAGQAAAHYGAAYLFMRYFADRFGRDALPRLLSLPGRGADLFDNYLAYIGARHLRFEDLVADWAVANVVGQQAGGSSRFGYAAPVTPTRAITALGPANGAIDTLSEYAASYYLLPSSQQRLSLQFQGPASAALMPTQAHSGHYFWWSNRGDVMDSRLTFQLDLRSVSRATLRFWDWYDLEDGFDYVYLSASADGGRTWLNLPTTHTTGANPAGNNLGQGWTGVSGGGQGPVWQQEEVDLASLVGRQVLLRFDYVTDDGINGAGFALDDLEVPAIGFAAGAEIEDNWQGEGFFRSDGTVPQTYRLYLVRQDGENIVQKIGLDSLGDARLRLSPSGDQEKRILVVTAFAPLSTQTVDVEYSLALLPASRRIPIPY